MFFLIGVNHNIQYRNKNDIQIKDFICYIKFIVKENQIEILAEEFNEDCLSINHVNNSVLQEVADADNLKHVFFEPSYYERSEMGIPKNYNDEETINYFSRREEFWLMKLKPYMNNQTLVICGADHMDSFPKLLDAKSILFQILNKQYDEKKTLEYYKWMHNLS